MSQSVSAVINDMSIQVATVNGSGSQSANTVLLRSIFQMGVPVSGKNLFPSNIAGLPTWYTIRASKDGYIARKKEIDFLVAMNAETAQEDVLSLRPGARGLRRAAEADRAALRLVFYPVPFDKLVAPVCPEAKLRKLVKNMIYVGVVAQLLGIEMAEVEKAIRKQFREEGQGRRAERRALPGRLRVRHGRPARSTTRSRSRGWTRTRARSSSTATPPPRWVRCSPA